MSYQFSNEEISPKRSIKRRSSPRKVLHISDDVQEDIDNLLENVPEVKAVFTVLNKIGSGTFSSVYVAKLKNYPDVTERFALKHIIPTSHPSRIESELKCLQEIGGSQNVMGVEACIRHKDHVVIVMPYFHHDKFQDYVRDVRIDEVKDYMKNLFLSLKSVHDHNMIHRDVKPSNFLVNRKKRLYSLVDFGLAQKCAMKKPERSTHVPTPSVHPDKSQIKSSQSTENVNKRLPLSPRQAKIIDNGKSTANSPRKRKLVFDAQERNESPSKRRFSKNDDKAITSCDSSMNKENPTDKPKHLTSTVAFNNASKKSPRRQLLMKRAGGIDGGGHSGVMVSSSGKSMYKSVAPSACQCFGKPIVCTICLSRMNQQAPRAGTPGFRSPEVLIKCPDQTMAIDVWSAGVIFLSLLSGRYPFFKADDDMSALAQIISVIGSQEMKDAAKSNGKEFIMSPMVPAVDLRVMCLRLRGCLNENNKVKAESSKSNWIHLPSSVWDLLAKALDPNPITRITAAEALKHPYLANS